MAKKSVKDLMLAQQAAANKDTVLEQKYEPKPGEEDFEPGTYDDLADAMAKGAGEISDEPNSAVVQADNDLLSPVLELGEQRQAQRQAGEGLHCLVGESVPGMHDFFYPVAGDPHPAGVRHSPDGQNRFWFDKVLVNVGGKQEALWRFDRNASEKIED